MKQNFKIILDGTPWSPKFSPENNGDRIMMIMSKVIWIWTRNSSGYSTQSSTQEGRTTKL